MTAETDLAVLLSTLSPQLRAGEFVFCSLEKARYGEHAHLSPLAAFQEEEGLTLILPRERALESGFNYDGIFRCITLNAYSSLNAVGLTAAVASVLADDGISANVVAAWHHDHIFVPSERADDAMALLAQLAS